MIVKIVLTLSLVAFAMMLLADVLLRFGLPSLPELVTQLAILTLLSAFLLLVAAGLFMLSQHIILAWKIYFSAGQRLQRRLWFIQAKQDRLVRLLHFRRLQISYFTKLKTKQLLSVNDQQQLQLISKDIAKNLSRLKGQLPNQTYIKLHQEHRQCLVLKDIQALLRLQQKIHDFQKSVNH